MPPSKLVLRQRSGYGIALAALILMLFFFSVGFGLALASGAKPEELVLPALALGIMALSFVLLFSMFTFISTAGERRQIRRLLNGDLWALWQYPPEQWRQLVEARHALESKMFKPMYNLIVGPIFGGILVIVAFAVPAPFPEFPLIVLGVAAFVTLLFVGSGLILPLQQRRARRRRYRQRLKIAAPRIWISRDGFYHEADGYQSLDALRGVSLEAQQIIFAVQERIGGAQYTINYLAKVELPIPHGCENAAGVLVQRYQFERGIGAAESAQGGLF